MPRALILAALFSLLSFASRAACPSATSPTCGDPMQTTTSGSVMCATAYGVKADATYTLSGGAAVVTGTSNDVALKAAVDACAAKGATLILPPGMMLLTGAATTNVRNCTLQGAGSTSGHLNTPGTQGTMFLITSTTVKPFTIGDHFGFTGSNFFWPNQITGLTVYPPLFSPEGNETDETQQWHIAHCVLINPYDGIVTGGGAFNITDTEIYPMNDAIRIGNIGDHVMLSNVHFTPGPWFTMTNFTAPYLNVSLTSTAIHVRTGGNNQVGFSAANIASFSIGTFLKIDAGALVQLSQFSAALDGVGTIIDASSGGKFAGFSNAPISGMADCNDVCFKMGNNSQLYLNGFNGTATKSFIEASDGFVDMANSQVTGVGSADAVNDYYGIHVTGNSGGMNLLVKGTRFTGKAGSAKAHGIKTDVALARLTVIGNSFSNFQDDLDVKAAGTTIITNNWSTSTLGSESIVSASMTMTPGIVYANNQWDKPPKAVASNCGPGCSVLLGAFSGEILVGSTAPTTTGTLTTPWSLYGGTGGLCQFYAPGPSPQAFITGAPASSGVWNFDSGTTDIHNRVIYFDCQGQQ